MLSGTWCFFWDIRLFEAGLLASGFPHFSAICRLVLAFLQGSKGQRQVDVPGPPKHIVQLHLSQHICPYICPQRLLVWGFRVQREHSNLPRAHFRALSQYTLGPQLAASEGVNSVFRNPAKYEVEWLEWSWSAGFLRCWSGVF